MVQNKATVKDLLLKGSVLSSIDASAYQTYAYIIDHLHEDGSYALKSDLADIDLDSIWERFGEQILAAVSANLSAYALSDVVKREYSLTSHTHPEYVNKTRKIAGKALGEDITAAYLSGAIGLGNYVPTSRTVVGKRLTSNVTAADISNAIKLSSYALSADVSANYSLKTHTHSNYVPTSRKVAGIKLSSDITQAQLSSAIGLSNYSLTSHTHSNYVPTSRKVAGIKLSSDITPAQLTTAIGLSNYSLTSHTHTGYVPSTRTVVGLPLSSNITKDQMSEALGLKDGVPPHTHPEYALSSRKVAGKALSNDVTAADISSAIGLGNYVTIGTVQTVTGKKTFKDSLNTNGTVNIVNTTVDSTVPVAATTTVGQYRVLDKNSKEIGRVISEIASDNGYNTYLQATKILNGTSVRSSLRCKVADDGSTTAYAPAPAVSADDTRIATTHFVKAQGYALSSRRIAGNALSGDVTAADISSAIGLGNYSLKTHTHPNYVLTSRSVAGYKLSSDVTVGQLSTALGLDKISLNGREGDVAYLTPNTGVCAQTILRSDVYVCESDDDVSSSMNKEMSMKEVFNSWIKGGAYGDKYYGYDADYADNVKTIGDWLSYNIATYAQPQEPSQLKNATKEEMGTWSWPATSGSDRPLGNLVGYPYWFYNDVVSSIIQAANTIDTAWYVSPIPYTKYDITVRCRAYGTDDDIIGIVIASIPSTNGRPKNLNFCRSPNNTNTEGYQPACHAYIRSYNVWADAGDIASSFNVRDLSSEFLASMTVYQSRFTATNGNYSPMPGPDKPAYYPIWQNANNNWQWRSSDLRGFWNSHPTPYERKYYTSLYKVVPQNVDIGSQPLSGWALKSPNERIDINNLSSPENWWWMNSGQSTAHYAKCTKNFGWHNAGISYLRVKRDGDHISCWTTKFTGNVNNLDDIISSANRDFNGPVAVPDGDAGWNTAVASKNAFLMTLDLASNVNVPGGGKLSDWGLASHPEGGRIGFVTASQTGASWDIIKMDIPKTVVKTQTNEVIMHDPITGSDTTQTTLGTDFCGIGRICKNLATDKSFYVTANNTFLKLAAVNGSSSGVAFNPATGILNIDGTDYSIVTQTTYNPDVIVTLHLYDDAAGSSNNYTCKMVNATYEWNVKNALGQYIWASDTTISRPFVATAVYYFSCPDQPTYGIGLIVDGYNVAVFHPKYSLTRAINMNDGMCCDSKYLGYFKGEGGLIAAASSNKGFYKSTTSASAVDSIKIFIKYV